MSRYCLITLTISLAALLCFCGCESSLVGSEISQDRTIPTASSQLVSAPAGSPVDAINITIAPHRLIVNSVSGQADDVQAIVPMYIESGYLFTEGDATLVFKLGDDEFMVAEEACSMRYCYVDDNLLIGFDRESVLGNQLVIDLAGETVTAIVEGYFTATNGDGDSYQRDFIGTDQVIIEAPSDNWDGSKKKI